MAGFFGLFNYDKVGPGIAKDAPKKKTFFVFFETFFRNFWKFITINIVYYLISLPIITNGLASAGLTNVTRNIARDKHSFGLSEFFETIKKNWKQSLACGIINTVVYTLIIFDIYFFTLQESSLFSTICLGISFAVFFVFTIMNFYIWTLIITFKFNLKAIYRNSFKFVFINLKGNLICFFGTVIVYAIYIGILYLLAKYYVFAIITEIAIFILTYPAFKYLMVQFCVFPSIKKYIIDPYYKEHPDEDIEKRQRLGLEVNLPKPQKTDGEDGEDEPENVFTD